MKFPHLKLALSIAIPAVLAAGCASGPMASGPTASAALAPKSGSSTTGTVRFAARGSDKVMVTVDISGLKPNAEHGFHVHEKGDCSAPDAMSAGGHFNPTGMQHGGAMGGVGFRRRRANPATGAGHQDHPAFEQFWTCRVIKHK